MTTFTLRTVTLAICVLAFTAACSDKIDNAQHAEEIKTLVGRTPAWVDKSALGRRLWKIEQEFYAKREYLPAWVDGVATTDHWKDLIQQLKYSEAHGLDPAKYGFAEFEQLREQSQTKISGTQFPVERVPEMDAKMTYAYLRYAADLIGWTHTPKDVHPNWLTDPKKDDLAARLTEAIANNTVRDSLEQLAPTHPQYRGLQAALALEKDPARANVIRMNMERWRWAPRDLGERYVLVNVPAYIMQVMEGAQPTLSMRVIVGEPENQTPLFSDVMEHIVFSPYWNIPPGILKDETLPAVARDPDFLLRNNIEVVGTGGTVDPWSVDWTSEEATRGLRFRQRPGASNALGLVKFMFPNRFNVYLHDTPGDKLFFKEKRAFSHGCIRIEDPTAMAKYVLRDQPEWDEPRIVAAMNARQERHVKLKSPIPVHIGYWTAWVEPDGKTVTFTDDPYGIDRKHARLGA